MYVIILKLEKLKGLQKNTFLVLLASFSFQLPDWKKMNEYKLNHISNERDENILK